MPRRATPGAVQRVLGPALGSIGVVVLVLGTFLPWLDSGQARRNSYQAGGALRRLRGTHGLLDVIVSAWPFVALLCAVVVVIFTLGLHRCAALLAAVLALAAGAVTLTTLPIHGSRFLRPVSLGPTVTLFGAGVLLAAATLVLMPPRIFRGPQRRRP